MSIFKVHTEDRPADGRLLFDLGGGLPRPRRHDRSYRLVALDLDGSLLDPAHRISPANRHAVQDCLDRGVRVVLASGRLFASVRPHCRSLRLVGPQITLNGAIIADADSGASSAVAGLAAEAVAAAAGALTGAGLPFVVFGRDGIYTRSHGAHCDLLMEYGEPRPVVVPALDGRSLPDPVKVVTFVAEGSSAERKVRSAMRGR